MTETAPNELNRDFWENTLRLGIVNVKFIKADGSVREFRATLAPEFLPPPPVTTTKPPRNINPESTVIRVYLPDETVWRSFDYTSVINYHLELPDEHA